MRRKEDFGGVGATWRWGLQGGQKIGLDLYESNIFLYDNFQFLYAVEQHFDIPENGA